MLKVLIISGTETFAYNIMRSLSSLDVEMHVLGHQSVWLAMFSRLCRSYHQLALDPSGQFSLKNVPVVTAFCAVQGINVVIPVDLRAAYFMAHCRASLPKAVKVFPCSSEKVLDTLHNKWEFSQLLTACDVPQPRSLLIKSREELERVLGSEPCILKPLAGEGGLGLRYLRRDRADALAVVKEGWHFPLLYQAYIPGADAGVSVLAQQGRILAVTMQRWVDTTRMCFFQDPILLGHAAKIVAHVNYNGVAHFDIRIDSRDGSYHFIECNPRFWNSLCASLYAGVNFASLGVSLITQGQLKPVPVLMDVEYMMPVDAVRKSLRGTVRWQDVPVATKKDLRDLWREPHVFLFRLIGNQ